MGILSTYLMLAGITFTLLLGHISVQKESEYIENNATIFTVTAILSMSWIISIPMYFLRGNEND